MMLEEQALIILLLNLTSHLRSHHVTLFKNEERMKLNSPFSFLLLWKPRSRSAMYQSHFYIVISLTNSCGLQIARVHAAPPRRRHSPLWGWNMPKELFASSPQPWFQSSETAYKVEKDWNTTLILQGWKSPCHQTCNLKVCIFFFFFKDDNQV